MKIKKGGFIDQMKNNPIKDVKFTREYLEKVISTLFSKTEPSDKPVDITNLVAGVVNKAAEKRLFKKILNGYWYEIDSGKLLFEEERQIKARTGSGGAKEMIKIMLEEGMTEKEIGDAIFVYIPEKGRYSLNEVNIKKDGENKDNT